MGYIVIDNNEEFETAYYSNLNKAISDIVKNGEAMRERDITILKAALIASGEATGRYRRFHIKTIQPNKLVRRQF